MSLSRENLTHGYLTISLHSKYHRITQSGVTSMNKYQARFVASVLTKVLKGQYSKSEACQKTGYSRQYIYELLDKFKQDGYQSLIHKNTRRAPINKIDFNRSKEIVRLYKDKYYGFNYAHFKEMLLDYEYISVSYCTLHRLLTETGFVSPRHQKTRHIENLHPTRDRRKSFGELIQIDGSIHLWFGSSKFTLHAAIDDSTSTIVGAYFDKEETLSGYYLMFKQILTKYGIPQEFYADRRTIFDYRHLDEKEKALEKDTFTQFQRCCRQLGVEIHVTSISQAKGRVERLFNTLQDRLISEMRLNDIKNVQDANTFLPHYIARHNKKFALPIDEITSLFVPPPREEELDYYLSIEYERSADNGSVFSLKGKKIQVIDGNGVVVAFPGKAKAKFYETLDGRFVCVYEHCFYETITSTYLHETIPYEKKERKKSTYVPPPNHPWRRYAIRKKDK